MVGKFWTKTLDENTGRKHWTKTLDENSKPVRHAKRYVYENGPCFTLWYKKNIEKHMTTVLLLQLKIKFRAFISIE